MRNRDSRGNYFEFPEAELSWKELEKIRAEIIVNELKSLLIGVPNSYYDFVEGMLQLASKSDYAKNELIEFIKSNPTASSGEVILFATRKFELYSTKTEQTA